MGFDAFPKVDWDEVPLSELTSANVTYGVVQPGSSVSDGVPMIRVKNFDGHTLNLSEVVRISHDVERKYERTRVCAGDVLITVVGSVGQVAIVPPELIGWNIARAVALIRPKSADLVRWIAYFLRSPIAQHRMGIAANTTVQTTVNLKDLRTMAIPMPPESVRRGITELLSALDDRIDLLRQTNTTLEAIAQALFKSWFVDFDPVHAKAEGRAPEAMDAATAALFPSEFEQSELGPIPKGWRSVLSGEIYEVGIGKTPPRKEPHWFTNNAADVAWASIRDMGAAGVFLTCTSEFLTREAVEKFNVRMVPEGSVIMSFKLTVGRLAIADCDMTTNEAIAHFKPKQGSLPQSFLYCFLKSFDMYSLSSTSSIANATNSKAIRNIPILHPGIELAQKFDALACPLLERIRMQQHQMLTLESLRDALLPRLISGKLRLPEVAKAVEEGIA